MRARIASRSIDGTPSEVSALETQLRECSTRIGWPHAGHDANPSIRRRSPSRDADESLLANLSTRIAAPDALSRFDSGTRTGVLQIGQRAGLRQVHVMAPPGSPPPSLKASGPARGRERAEGRSVATAERIMRPRRRTGAMATPATSDPVRATFVAILQQLNRAESIHEGRAVDQALYLDDLERTLRRFWAIDQERVRLPMVLGLLVRNGLVHAEASGAPAGGKRAAPRARYRITPEGKQFLVDALQKADRIA
jgi:hypothetical protein